MRKSVKLVAASSFAAVAMLGATATVASATGHDGGHRGKHYDKDDHGLNVCGNADAYPLAVSDSGEATDDVLGTSSQFKCQNGKANHARISHDGDVAGGGIEEILSVATDGGTAVIA